jgi:hypothetical protein
MMLGKSKTGVKHCSRDEPRKRWVYTVKFAGKKTSKTFADANYGFSKEASLEALKIALKERKIVMRARGNKTGVRHGQRDDQKNRWVAVLRGKKHYFPDSKYPGGKQEAFEAMKLFLQPIIAKEQDPDSAAELKRLFSVTATRTDTAPPLTSALAPPQPTSSAPRTDTAPQPRTTPPTKEEIEKIMIELPERIQEGVAKRVLYRHLGKADPDSNSQLIADMIAKYGPKVHYYETGPLPWKSQTASV